MNQKFSKIQKINGGISLPGDKSISHRALIFSALAEGTSKIQNLANSDDVKTTIRCLQKLGVQIKDGDDAYFVQGVGRNGFKEPGSPINCGNSGTTARLLSGVLAAQNFPTILIGDESLSRRPMKRIIEPLGEMGCKIESSNAYTLPLHIYPSGKIKSIEYELTVASAQVKGAVLLAGLHCDDSSTIIENNLFTRDHTERMLNLPVEQSQGKKIIKVSDSFYPKLAEYFIPSDISTAAFFIVLTLLTEDSSLLLKDVSLNPSRTAIISILKRMGGEINVEQKGASANEPLGNIYIKSSKLKNVPIEPELIPAIIDEIPILTIAGIFADREFVITGAQELKVKESDRIKSICSNLLNTGLDVTEFSDGFSINGKIEHKFQTFESFSDHRIAMAFSILSCLIEEGSEVNNFECVSVSNPDFLRQLESVKSQ